MEKQPVIIDRERFSYLILAFILIVGFFAWQSAISSEGNAYKKGATDNHLKRAALKPSDSSKTGKTQPPRSVQENEVNEVQELEVPLGKSDLRSSQVAPPITEQVTFPGTENSETPASKQVAKTQIEEIPQAVESSSIPFRFPLEGEVPEQFVTAGISSLKDDTVYLYFPAGSAALSPSAESALEQFSASLQESTSAELHAATYLDVRETGRTDLPELRLTAIMDFLHKNHPDLQKPELPIPILESITAQETSWEERMRARRVEVSVKR
jgi:hypothetical protein